MKTAKPTAKHRTSTGSGKTRGAVSLANVKLSDLLKIVRDDADIPVGRVFAEGLGFRMKPAKHSGDKPQMVLA